MFNPKISEKTLSYNDLILERLKDIKDGQRELKTELQTTKRELNERMDKLDGRMTGIENELRNVARHSQIMTASVVGIALAVVYFIFTH